MQFLIEDTFTVIQKKNDQNPSNINKIVENKPFQKKITNLRNQRFEDFNYLNIKKILVKKNYFKT